MLLFIQLNIQRSVRFRMIYDRWANECRTLLPASISLKIVHCKLISSKVHGPARSENVRLLFNVGPPWTACAFVELAYLITKNLLSNTFSFSRHVRHYTIRFSHVVLRMRNTLWNQRMRFRASTAIFDWTQKKRNNNNEAKLSTQSINGVSSKNSEQKNWSSFNKNNQRDELFLSGCPLFSSQIIPLIYFTPSVVSTAKRKKERLLLLLLLLLLSKSI